MTLFGGPSYFCLSSSYAYVFLFVVVLMHLHGLEFSLVDFLVVYCLVVGLQHLVELLVGFLG